MNEINTTNNYLATYCESSLNTSLINNSYGKLQLQKFNFVTKTKKYDCTLIVVRDKMYHGCEVLVNSNIFSFMLTIKSESNETPYIITMATISNHSRQSFSKRTYKNFFEHSCNNSLTVYKSSVDDLKELKSKYGQLFFCLYMVDVSVSSVDSKCISNLDRNLDENKSEMNFSISSCCELTKDLATLNKDTVFTDVVLLSNNKEFKVHRNILSARSPYFAALFTHDTVEKRDSCVAIKDKDGQLLDEQIVEEFIQYVYTGIAKNLDQYALELYEMADMYNMEVLISYCIAYLKENIKTDNALILLIFAKKFGIKDLETEIINFFRIHSNNILESENLNFILQSE